MEPPNDLQRNSTVSPRAESRSLACFILASRGQARLTSTSPVHRHRQCHVLSARLSFSTDEASCAPPPSLIETMRHHLR